MVFKKPTRIYVAYVDQEGKNEFLVTPSRTSPKPPDHTFRIKRFHIGSRNAPTTGIHEATH